MLSNILIKKLENQGPETKGLISTIFNTSMLTNFLVQNLLDHELIERGKIKIQLTKFNLDHVLCDVFRILTEQSLKKKNRLIKKFSPNFPPVTVSDKNRIYQVLLKLLFNSNKFT